MQNNNGTRKKSWGIFIEYRWIILAVILLGITGYWVWSYFLREYEKLRLAYQSNGSGVVIDDPDTLAGNNNDGRLNPGERVMIRLLARNVGDKPLAEVNLKISTKDPAVNLIDDKIRFTNIDTGQIALSNDAFELELQPNASLEQISLLSEIEDAEAGNGTPAKPDEDQEVIPIALDVYSSMTVCVGATVVEQGAGGSDPDLVIVNLSLCNTGNNTMANVRVQIDAGTIKLCSARKDTFKVVSEQGLSMDSHFLGDVISRECKAAAHTFKFTAPAILPAMPDSTLCLSFGVRIFPADSPPIFKYVGANAKVIRRATASGIAAAGRQNQ